MHRSHSGPARRLSGVRLAAAAVGVVAALASTFVAGSATADASHAAAPARWAAQAHALGLTAAQEHVLQARVDRVVAQTGGTQVSINRVLWPDRSGDTTLVVPGRQRVQQFTPNGTPQATCPYYDLCTYESTGYAGTQHRMYNCQTYYTPYWFGSYTNNQTHGTVARFYDYNSIQIATSTAYQTVSNSGALGGQTWYIRPC